ncbi:MAG: AraC family transcriptional regulator [Gammaproteobacteria bacterium]|jgi:AraC family transcriptional regulator|nr:AraC family transcriptional regulator [Gammaproteobacteria bacterium]
MRVRTRNTNELVAQAKEYVARNTNARVRLADVARVLGVSPAILAPAFRSVEKISFYQYALRLRLRSAAALLSTSVDLATLALDLGFASHSHFSTAFLRWSGSTPSAFRARVRSEPGDSMARIERGGS